MKRGLALFLTALLAALTLTACGGAGGSGSSSAAADSADSEYFYNETPPVDGGQWGWDYEALTDAPSGSGSEDDSGSTENRLLHAKMVYTANVEAETMDFDACAASLEALVESLGGYLEYASTGSYGNGSRSGSYTARIPASRFRDFLRAVGEIGHVTSQEIRSDNISEMYYDTESRLTTQRTKMERLQALLARAENMEDIITLESAIAETELEIEQLTGSLRHYDSLVDFSTVELRIREVIRLSTVEETPPTFASRLGNAFSGGWDNFLTFLEGLAIFLAYSWPGLVVLALILLLLLRASKRRTDGTEKGFFQRKKTVKNPDDKQPKD